MNEDKIRFHLLFFEQLVTNNSTARGYSQRVKYYGQDPGSPNF